jgi:putative glutamine amidotransferase
MKPIIGITVECQHDPANERSQGKMELNWNYAAAVAEAGGVPVVIPPTADMDVVAQMIDGWLIPGGADIDSKHWNEPLHPKAELQDPARFDSEARLYLSVPAELPIFGICYGCQFLNVIEGGSLIQHLPDTGREGHSGGTLQEYALSPSRLRELVGTEKMEGKSYHHQAIGKVAPGISVVGHSEDGVIEAIESTSRPWTFAVQWHPERTLADPASRALFEQFIEAARAYRATKKELR